MTAAGVLASRKEGLKVMYRVKTPCLLGFMDCIKECLIEQAKEQQQMLETLNQE